MKVANVTLPLMALLFLSGNSLALAGSASALDPYAYIQAPTKAEREQQQKKTKKFKVKKLKAAKEKAPEEIEPIAKDSPKPATVIISTASPKAAGKKTQNKTASTETASSEKGSGFLDGIKQGTGEIAKSTKAVGSSMVIGSKSVGSKIAEGFKSAGEKVKDGTAVAGEKMAVVPKKIGEGVKSTSEKVKEGSASVGEKVASSFKTASGSLAAAPAAGLGAISHSISKINPFHKSSKAETPPTATAQQPVEPAKATAQQEPVTAAEPSATQLGERIKIPANQTHVESTAAAPGAVPQ